MAERHLESFGDPIIKIGSLSLWVHGYEFPQATDGWDGNWLRITARCAANGASVLVTGSILDTVSFARFRREVNIIREKMEGAATLRSHEPNLRVTLKPKGTHGHIDVEIEITPDHTQQRHRFFEVIDQSYLPAMHKACDAVLHQFPVRDPDSRGDFVAD